MPMVRPGDASLAAAFTSRVPSIKSTVDIIRQGRCALLSALQQQQIVVLHCLINAYVLSALSLEGSRTSERQMMASSWLLNIANFAFSYARPCDKIHPVRPLRSLFQKAVFVSLFGQAIIHLGCLVYATSLAREAMEPDSLARQNGLDVGPSLADVSEFWKKQRLIRRGVLGPEEVDDEDLGFLELTLKQWMSPFLPNLMNTVVFLVETSQTVAVLAVNYKGQPWMKGLVENRPLFLSVFIVIGALAGCAWELIPQANAMIHLTPFPGDSFRIQIMMLVLISIFGTAVWDRLCVWFFSPEIFWAMWRSAMQTTFRGDVLPVITDCGKILVGVFLFKHGIPGWIALFFWYKHRKKED
jgi:cation-transporting ATPase 13A1